MKLRPKTTPIGSVPTVMLGVVWGVTVLFTSSCAPEPASLRQPPTTQHQTAAAKSKPPIRIIITLDKTSSLDNQRLASLTMPDIQKVADLLLKQGGGELAVGFLCSNSDTALIRMLIPPKPLLDTSKLLNPAKPDPNTENPLTLGDKKRQYEQALAKDTQLKEQYHKKVQAWQTDAQERVQSFESKVKPLLTKDFKCTHTDIFGGISRANLFLNERSAVWSSSPIQYALFITDGIHNTANKEVKMAENVTVLLVNGSHAEKGIFKNIKHQPFESPETAIAHLIATIQGEQ